MIINVVVGSVTGFFGAAFGSIEGVGGDIRSQAYADPLASTRSHRLLYPNVSLA